MRASIEIIGGKFEADAHQVINAASFRVSMLQKTVYQIMVVKW